MNMSQSSSTVEPYFPSEEYVIRTLARAALEATRRAMQVPENRRRFEEWYLKKYGRRYNWENPSENE